MLPKKQLFAGVKKTGKNQQKIGKTGLLFKAFDGHFTILPDFLVFFRSFF
jgi:hypothetical protein